MPQRTRNHLIEEESRLYFKQSLPSYWLCRDKHEDYGIDCEVEVFDDEGNPTGLVFWVQLKGTDSKDSSKIQKIYFEKDKIMQFQQYEIPVLIVRFATHNKTIYARWAGGLTAGRKAEKMIPTFFPKSTLWTEETISDVVYYLRNQLAIKQGKLSLPLPTFVEKSLEVDEASVPYENLIAVKACLSETEQYFVLRQNKRDAPLHLLVSHDTIFFNFSGIRLARMKVTFDKLGTEHRNDLIKHILTTFVSMLFEFGKTEIANEIIFQEDLLPVVLKDQEFLLNILPSLLRGNRFADTMMRLEKYIRHSEDDTMLVQLALKILLLQNRRTLPSNKLTVIEHFLVREFDFQISRKNEASSGAAAYNLAGHYKSMGMHVEAIKYYLLARRFSPFYKDAHYYYSDLAGSLFGYGKYKFAVWFYSKSINLGSDNSLVQALLADAFLHAGDYQKAVEAFDKYLHSNSEADNNEEWYLKHSMLKSLLHSGYDPHQKRNPQESDLFLAKGDYDKAIEADFLCEPAWYNLGVMESTSNNSTTAFVAFTFSALLYKADAEVWAQSFIHGLFASADMNFLVWIVRIAHFQVGQDFVDNIMRILKKNEIDGDQILEFIDKTIPDKCQPPMTVRVFFGEGIYEEIKL